MHGLIKSVELRSELFINFCKNSQGHITNMINIVIFMSDVHIYKSFLREKKEQYSAKMVSAFEINMCNAKLFWQNMKKIGSKARLTSNIYKEIWHDHFYNAFNTHFNVLTEIFQQYPLIHDDINMLNGIFKEEEICTSLKNLKKKESCRSRWTSCRNISFVIAYRCSILTKTV